MAYKDFSSLVRSRADRLYVHDMQYRLEGRELVKNDFLRWIVQTEREIVSQSDLWKSRILISRSPRETCTLGRASKVTGRQSASLTTMATVPELDTPP